MPLIQVDVEVDVDLDDVLEDVGGDELLDWIDDGDIAEYAIENLDMVETDDEEYQELVRKAELYDELMGGNDE